MTENVKVLKNKVKSVFCVPMILHIPCQIGIICSPIKAVVPFPLLSAEMAFAWQEIYLSVVSLKMQ